MNHKAIKIAIILTAIAVVVLNLPIQPEEVLGVQPLFNDAGAKVYTNCNVNEGKKSNLENELKNLKAKNPDNSLRALNAKERASVKGCEIAKLNSLTRTARANYDIEIVSTNPIEGGVEVFARAWDKQGNQIGFGKDGSVDIERFRIFNPPVLVSDPTGTITRTFTDLEGQTQTQRYREDLQEAVLQSLEHTLSVKKEKFDSSKIVAGKIGNTTSTFYPSAGSVEPFDGDVRNQPAQTSWATLRDATAGTYSATESDAVILMGYLDSGTSNGTWDGMTRGMVLFDTSTIGTDSISSATLSLYGNAANSVDNFGQGINIVSATPASTSEIVDEDYDQFGTTIFKDADISLATFDADQYHDFGLNASGIANIAKTGISKFGTRLSGDINNVEPTWENNVQAAAYIQSADTAGTTQDPKLVVEHTAVVAASVISDLIIFN